MAISNTEIRGQVHARTERAILFSTDGDCTGAVWLPLSRVEVGKLHHGVGVVTMPADLAEGLA